MRGASFLFGREAIGSVVRLIGVIITVRMIGPSNYGVFTAAAAYVAVIVTICQMGSEVFLIRAHEQPTKRLNNEIFTLLLVTSVALSVVALGLTFVLAPLIKPAGTLVPLRVLLLCVPINALWAPAQAHIERAFDYKKMGILELGGDIVLYAVAVPLALLHFGAWSLVAGYFAWQTFLLVGSLLLSGLRPRLAWSTKTAKDVIRHGTSYSTSMLFVNLVFVVPPIVVGTFVGAAGVGYVSFGRNLVNTVGFAKRAAYRLGIVTMAQINRDDPKLFRQGLERGAFLLTLALGVSLRHLRTGRALDRPRPLRTRMGRRTADLLPPRAGLGAQLHRVGRSLPLLCAREEHGGGGRTGPPGALLVRALDPAGQVLGRQRLRRRLAARHGCLRLPGSDSCASSPPTPWPRRSRSR